MSNWRSGAGVTVRRVVVTLAVHLGVADQAVNNGIHVLDSSLFFLGEQILRIQAFQFVQHEEAVLADQHVIEPDLAPAVLRRLDLDQVPMDGGMVAVGGIVVAVAGGQVEAAGDLLVEQNVPMGWLISGFTPKANSPMYRAPSSMSRISFI